MCERESGGLQRGTGTSRETDKGRKGEKEGTAEKKRKWAGFPHHT